MVAAWARQKGLCALTLGIDLEKFNEQVLHQDHWCEARALGFNLKLLRVLCAMYGGWRAVISKGSASEMFPVNGTILAACCCATTLAKIVLNMGLRTITQNYSAVKAKKVIGYILLQAAGPETTVMEQMGGATADLLGSLRESASRCQRAKPLCWLQALLRRKRL